MYRDSFIGEKFVSHIWDGGHFTKDALRAKDGRRIEVINRGRWNDDSGADFRDAEVSIGGQIHSGDVEVHVKNSHWKAHHHDVDPRYNSTILHVAMWDDCTNLLTTKQNGQRIPTLVLHDYLDRSIGKLWKKIEQSDQESSPCSKAITPEVMGAILDRAGMDRFLRRAEALEERLREVDADQLLYEGIMESLGYSKNKQQFLELAGKVPLETLAGHPPEKIQAVLFGVAGLLPSQNRRRVSMDQETKDYVSEIEALWKSFSSHFEGTRMSREQWEFFRIRPENFPTKRIAGMSYILSNCADPPRSLMSMFLSAFRDGYIEDPSCEPEKTYQGLRDMLMSRASGYWTRHYTFGGKPHRENHFLIGQNRAADVVFNVVLPIVFAWAHQSRNEALEQAVTRVYASKQKLQENKITRYVASRVLHDGKDQRSVINSAMRQQGLIHLYKSFCDAGKCQNCPLAEENM